MATPNLAAGANTTPRLAERHLRELHASSIPDPCIVERGYRSVSDPTELRRLGFAGYQARPGLLIPLCDTSGTNGRYALKPDRPRVEQREGKADRPIKYEYPAGQTPILDVPPRCLAQIGDATVPLWFTEGAKKADCLAGLGHCAVNVWGVHAWYTNPEHGGFKTIQPLEDWKLIKPTLNGRECYLAFDSDAWSKPSVGLALRRLANWLARHGALVCIVRLPDADDGSKLGVDDYAAAHGADAFEALVADAEPWGSAGMVRKLEAELRALRQQQSAEAEVLRNRELRPTEKIVAICAIREAGWRESTHAETPFVVNQGRLAESAGIRSRQTVGRALEVLAGPEGIFDKQTARDFSEATGWITVTRLTPRHTGVTPLLKAAAVYTPERPLLPPRSDPHCPDHPEARLHERRTLVCIECGQVVLLSEVTPSVSVVRVRDETQSETSEVTSCNIRQPEVGVGNKSSSGRKPSEVFGNNADAIEDQWEPPRIRWARETGWLDVCDPATGEWHSIAARGAPSGYARRASEAKLAAAARGRP